MSKLNAARERTDSKLRYSKIHLDELKSYRGDSRADGSDWERAHQESFLFQLFGVRDAVLQEINLFHDCGLPPHTVNMRRLGKCLEERDIQSQAFRALARLESMQSSWISIAGRMRNAFTHREAVPRTFHVHPGHVGQGNDGHVYLRDPKIDELKHELEKTGTPKLLEPTLTRPEWRAIRAASETDCLKLFSEWLAKAAKLVTYLRAKMPGAENG